MTSVASAVAPAVSEWATTAEDFEMIRTEVRRLCDKFGNAYWRSLEPDRYPEDFVAALTAQGWLGALIPEEYGGGGLSLAGASVILEYDIERKLRETRLYQVAPVNNNLVLAFIAQKCLGLPRSY